MHFMFDFLLILSVAMELMPQNSCFFSLAIKGKLPKDRASLECNNRLWKGKDHLYIMRLMKQAVEFACFNTSM